MNCGGALEQTCTNCSFVSPLSAHFCPNCGSDLTEPSTSSTSQPTSKVLTEGLGPATAVRGVEGERRTLTMLFCDVTGSTATAEQLDPETWTEIMNGAFERLIEPVYRYEGTVAQLMS